MAKLIPLHNLYLSIRVIYKHTANCDEKNDANGCFKCYITKLNPFIMRSKTIGAIGISLVSFLFNSLNL